MPYSQPTSKYSPPSVKSVSLADVPFKRKYLTDFEPFINVFKLKNISLQVLKGGLATVSLGLMEYNMHLERNMRLEMNAQDGETVELEQYNWAGALENSVARFREYSARFYISSVIRKVYEEIAFQFCDIRLMDRLTKDVTKSLMRKADKIASKLTVCSKVFYTFFYGNLLIYAASATYDGILQAVEAIQMKYAVKPKDILVWIAKKSTLTACNLTFASLGFAIGSFFNIPHGATIGSLAFELFGGAVVTIFIN